MFRVFQFQISEALHDLQGFRCFDMLLDGAVFLKCLKLPAGEAEL